GVIVRTGAQRLRPVFLTTITTIFGLMPLALNFSIDMINRNIIYGGSLSNMWVPLSQAVVSGMAFAAVLTLVATPAMLALPYKTSEMLQNIDDRFRLRQRLEQLGLGSVPGSNG
ncbi:MAG: efflux RND transporter permease subunit, partial [Gammaproteobacteria bacterium]|nr:efflux RND transporter permease subunit [Gammaproteobacteria bacterium]